MCPTLQVDLVRLRLEGVSYRVVHARDYGLDWPFPWGGVVLVLRQPGVPSYIGPDGKERTFHVTHLSQRGMWMMEHLALGLLLPSGSKIRVELV